MVLLVVILPAVVPVPVFNSTAPVANTRGSCISIFPPLPTAPEPWPVPPLVCIKVSCKVIAVAAVLRVTAPPLPPAPLLSAALLPVVMISAPVLTVKVPAPVASIETEPPANPAPEEEAPPEVVMSPDITMLPVVFPEPGSLTAEVMETAPPAVLALPVVTTVDVLAWVYDPEPVAVPPKASPVSLAPVTVYVPPRVVMSTLAPRSTSP